MSETNDCRTDGWLVASEVETVLRTASADPGRIRDVLQKARELQQEMAAELSKIQA